MMQVVSEHALETGIVDVALSPAHPDEGLRLDPVALEVRPEVNAAFVPALRLHVVAQAQVQHLGRKKPKPRLISYGPRSRGAPRARALWRTAAARPEASRRTPWHQAPWHPALSRLRHALSTLDSD
eukprot:scaffold13167_cov123-Isochrysis_galbana.AAC.6